MLSSTSTIFISIFTFFVFILSISGQQTQVNRSNNKLIRAQLSSLFQPPSPETESRPLNCPTVSARLCYPEPLGTTPAPRAPPQRQPLIPGCSNESPNLFQLQKDKVQRFVTSLNSKSHGKFQSRFASDFDKNFRNVSSQISEKILGLLQH